MLNASKKILLVSASLIALGGSINVLAAPSSNASPVAVERVEQRVNVNKASAEEIAAVLKGVGTKTANAIVAYRDAHGAFTTIDSLTLVKGIGAKTIEKNQSRIML